MEFTADGFDGYFRSMYDALREELARTLGGDARHGVRPTEVAHEVYLRLADSPIAWRNETHARVTAVHVARRVLVDLARTRGTSMRGGGRARVTWTDDVAAGRETDLDLLDLHDALEDLARARPRQHEVAVLRLFGGMTLAEIGDVLGIREDTAGQHWALARALLAKRLRELRP